MRTTPQTRALLDVLSKLQHATNIELQAMLQQEFPDVSATTVHRITKRLVAEGEIGQLRSPLNGVALFDTNPKPHSHFACWPCGKVYDIDLSDQTRQDVEQSLGKSILGNPLVITGIASDCPKYQQH